MELVLLAAILVCPIVMGTAMLLMWREMHRGSHAAAPVEESPEPEEGEARRA